MEAYEKVLLEENQIQLKTIRATVCILIIIEKVIKVKTVLLFVAIFLRAISY